MIHSTLTVVAVILFVICLTMIILGLKGLVESWMIMGGAPGEEDGFITLITGTGMIVIGIAVLDLIKSLLDSEIAEKTLKNTQERARDFLTRFLAVIVFAISAEMFINIARAGTTVEAGLMGDIAMMGIAVGAMLAGLAYYLKMTAPECRTILPRRD